MPSKPRKERLTSAAYAALCSRVRCIAADLGRAAEEERQHLIEQLRPLVGELESAELLRADASLRAARDAAISAAGVVLDAPRYTVPGIEAARMLPGTGCHVREALRPRGLPGSWRTLYASCGVCSGTLTPATVCGLTVRLCLGCIARGGGPRD